MNDDLGLVDLGMGGPGHAESLDTASPMPAVVRDALGTKVFAAPPIASGVAARDRTGKVAPGTALSAGNGKNSMRVDGAAPVADESAPLTVAERQHLSGLLDRLLKA